MPLRLEVHTGRQTWEVPIEALKWLSLFLGSGIHAWKKVSSRVPPMPLGMATCDTMEPVHQHMSSPVPLSLPRLLPCLKTNYTPGRVVSLSSQKLEPSRSSPGKGQEKFPSSVFTLKEENQLVTIWQFYPFCWYPDTLTFKLRNLPLDSFFFQYKIYQ